MFILLNSTGWPPFCSSRRKGVASHLADLGRLDADWYVRSYSDYYYHVELYLVVPGEETEAMVSIREDDEMWGGLENSPVLGSVWSGKKGSGMTTELMSYFLLSLAHISHRHISFPFAHYTAERSRAEQQSSSSAVTYLPSFPLRPIFIYLYPGPVLLYALSLWLLPKKKNIYFLFQPACPDSFRSPNVRENDHFQLNRRKNVWEN